MTIAMRPGEPLLGNPDADGKVLSSTTAGVRSWVPRGSEVLSSITLMSSDHPGTWSVDPDTDVFTCSVAHGLTVGTPISFGAGTGALPAGLAAEPEFYHVIEVPTPTTLKISLTFGGTSVDVTSAGTAGWVVKSLYKFDSTGKVGLVSEFDLVPGAEYDIYLVGSLAAVNTSGSYIIINAGVGRTLYANSGPTPPSFYATFSSGAYAARKYNKVVAHVNLRATSTTEAVFVFRFYGTSSHAIDYSTTQTRTAYQGGGVLVAPTGKTAFYLYDGFSGYALPGTVAIVVRRP